MDSVIRLLYQGGDRIKQNRENAGNIEKSERFSLSYEVGYMAMKFP